MWRKFLAFLALASMLAACDEAEMQPPMPVAEAALTSSKPMLPATRTAAERVVNKADQFGDFKASHPEVFGITNPPSVPVRPVAEWEEASKLMITYSSTNLPAGIRKNLLDVVKYGSQVVDVFVIYDETSAKNDFAAMMSQAGISPNAVSFVKWNNDSIWIRDSGPVSIKDDQGRIAFADFRYYHQRVYDDALPASAAGLWNVTDYRVPVDFEGGNFMNDTKGNCFTSQGILYANGVGEQAVKQYMKDYLGCQTLHIVKPLKNEGTTHIDMQSKIVSDGTIIVGKYDYSQDPANYQITNDNAAYFESLGYQVARMPMPTNSDGNFRTFINSLFVNGVNMVPVYSVNLDKQAEAMAIWQQVMPNWQHVPFNSDDVITWSGAIHCVTMTVGQGTLAPIENPGYACGGDWACYPDGTGTPPVQGCGDIDYTGCCDGELLQWCENGQLKSLNCADKQHCGWDAANGYYNCGTAGQADPSGSNPLSCESEPVCVPSCAGKSCGSDGCGGSCGSCGAGQSCQGGQCVGGPTGGCGDVTFEGCCDGSVLTWCENGELKSADCAGKPSCGWDAANGYYNCGTSGQADPSGANPKSCEAAPACVPDCAGRECGNDGCGGLCGVCGANAVCDAGTCVVEEEEPVVNPCPPGYTLDGNYCYPTDPTPADRLDGPEEEEVVESDSGCTAGRSASERIGLLFAALLCVLALLRRPTREN